jgi:hypothetical protein
LPGATGFAPVTVAVDSAFNLNGQSVTFVQPLSGGVTIGGVTPGHVNGDNSINLADIILLRRYVARHDLSGINFDRAAADVDGNGVINLADIILLRRYVARHDLSGINFDRAAANVNGDGVINLADIILLRRYVARHDVTLGSQVAMFSNFGVAGTFMGARDAVRTSIASASGYAGEYAYVTINLDENQQGLIGLQLDLQFDSDVITPVSVSAGNLIPLPLQPILGGNQMTLTFESAAFNNIYDTGELATIRFSISSDAEPGAVEISMNGILAMTGSPNFVELGVLASGGYVEIMHIAETISSEYEIYDSTATEICDEYEKTSWMVVTEEPEFAMGGAFISGGAYMPTPAPENTNETTTTE